MRRRRIMRSNGRSRSICSRRSCGSRRNSSMRLPGNSLPMIYWGLSLAGSVSGSERMLSCQPESADIPCSTCNPVKDGSKDARLERLHGETLAAL
ncbi:hypothetical protein EMIT0158MI4_210093 [Burkholderia ambifaria]